MCSGGFLLGPPWLLRCVYSGSVFFLPNCGVTGARGRRSILLAALPLGEDLVGRCVVTLWSRASPYLRVGVGRSGSTGGSPFAIEFFLTGIGRLSGWRRGLGSRLHGAASVWGRVHLHKVLLLLLGETQNQWLW